MKRSGWKLPFIAPIFLSLMFLKSDQFFTKKRGSSLTSYFINKKLSIYSGKNWKTIRIRKMMIGKKIGEYSMSKIFGSAIAESMAIKQKRKKEDKKKKKIK